MRISQHPLRSGVYLTPDVAKGYKHFEIENEGNGIFSKSL